VQAETERDRFMSAEEAKAYGLVDEVLHVDEALKAKKK
jgi:ATP-dependent protease ClpP protease subunit